jgi:pSer/pThr/pTyr-binding forkhead associated (FHA) protein
VNKHLHVVAGPDRGRNFLLKAGDLLLIGRSKATETRLNDPHISRVHCKVEAEGDEVVVIDNESAGGTFVNGKKITRQVLKPGDVIRIGETQLRLQEGDPSEQSTLAPMPPKRGTGSGKFAAGGPDQLADLVGKSVSHFDIDAIAGRGQTGIVFHAHDTKEDREVALKVLVPEFSKNDEEMQRFVRAMKTMLPLRHPNLVTLYGAGKSGPYCWIAMEFVDGESLTQVIQRIGTAGMLDWRHALRVAIHVGRALEFASGQQIIHRNITPQNIVVRSSDKLTKLGDLMLAKALEGAGAEQITRPGELLGDVRYMSPERTRATAEVDGRSDIYSLGATVFALLTGRPPFEGATLLETITKIRQAEPAKPKKFQLSIPDLFEGTVLRMLAKRPDDRYQTPASMLADLERVAKFQGMAL